MNFTIKNAVLGAISLSFTIFDNSRIISKFLYIFAIFQISLDQSFPGLRKDVKFFRSLQIKICAQNTTNPTKYSLYLVSGSSLLNRLGRRINSSFTNIHFFPQVPEDK